MFKCVNCGCEIDGHNFHLHQQLCDDCYNKFHHEQEKVDIDKKLWKCEICGKPITFIENCDYGRCKACSDAGIYP